MEIEKNENEIVIKIEKDEDKNFYEVFKNKSNIKEYLSLMNYIYTSLISDENCIFLLIEPLEYYKKIMSEKSVSDLNNELDNILDDIYNYVKEIVELIPYSERNAFYDPSGMISIPENGIIDYLEIINERMNFIKNLIKIKQNSTEKMINKL